MKVAVIAAIILIVIPILIEGGLRLILGFGKRPLYIRDPEIGYLLAPNQNVTRFGKTTIINQYSLRTDAITPKKDPETLRILMLGDSIINGNWWTDQEQILSELVKERLKISDFKTFEVLNASANSWGPQNQLAYLKRFGTFDSQLILLVMNTDDFFAKKPTDIVVGKDLRYPDHQPISAIEDILEQTVFKPKPVSIPAEKGDVMGRNLKAIKQMQTIANESQAQFIIAVTPLLREMDAEKFREQDQRGKNRLKRWAKEQNIEVIDCLEQFRSFDDPETLYRDHIHLSPQGDQLLADILAQAIENTLKNQK